MSKDFWQSTFPRIAAVVIAIAVFVLVFLDFMLGTKQLSNTDFWLIISGCALILATIATRLKMFNVIDFDSKFRELKETTEKEITNIKNQILTSIRQDMTPTQKVNNFISLDMNSIKSIGQNAERDFSNSELNNRISFLTRANELRYYAGGLLQIARMYQLTIINHSLPLSEGDPTEKETKENNEPSTTNEFRDKLDQRLLSWAELLLNSGIQHLFPFKIVGEETTENLTIKRMIEETESSLRLLPKLVDTLNNVINNKVPTPSSDDSKRMFAQLDSGLGNIRVAILFLGSRAILDSYKTRNILDSLREYLKKEIDKPTVEQNNK